MVYSYPLYNVSICNFNELFEFIKQQLQAQCIKYNLSKCDNDYKKMLMHCIVKACCDVVAQHKDTKLVFFVQPATLQCSDTLNNIKVCKWIPSILKTIQRYLPLKWYESSHDLDYFTQLINQNKGISFLHQISNKQIKVNYTFSKAHNFAKRYNLNFLSRVCFNDLKMRYALLNT